MENYTICKCKQVTYFDVQHALENETSFDSVQKMFDDVQRLTQCSTGCGGCHDKIMDAISEIMSR